MSSSSQPELTCAFGAPWMVWQFGDHHCLGCIRAELKLLQQFERYVELGIFDKQGYTRAECKAADKRKV